MANFRYQVIDSNGKMSEGIIEAASIGEASRKLKGDGKYIASLSLDKGKGIANMEIGSLSVDDLCRYLIHLHNDLGFEIVSLNELFEYPPNYISNAGDEE